MLVESSLSAVVKSVERCSLSEVAFYCPDALLHQSGYLLLIPADGLRIREVEDGIFVGRRAACVLHGHASVEEFAEEFVLGSEIRQLPETHMEAVAAHLLHHCHGVGKAVGGKLIVALPVNSKPSCVEVYDV